MAVSRVFKLVLIAGLLIISIAAISLMLWRLGGADDTESSETANTISVPVVATGSLAGGSEPPPQSTIKARFGGSGPAPRMIAPDIIPVPPVDVTTLERGEPRQPLTRPKTRDEGGWEIRLLHRPVVSAAGRIEAGGHAILIDGITTVQPGESCPGRLGEDWPCGNLARTALRGWIRGRAVHCRVPERSGDADIKTSCELAGQDIATWLVRNGWARPDDQKRFEDATQFARSNRLGIFRPE